MGSAQWGHGYWKGYADGRKKSQRNKRIYFNNDWKCAPHCWKVFLLRPVRIERCLALSLDSGTVEGEDVGLRVSLFGFTWDIITRTDKV